TAPAVAVAGDGGVGRQAGVGRPAGDPTTAPTNHRRLAAREPPAPQRRRRVVRLVDITSFFPTSCGGIKRYYREKARVLPRRGIEGHFFAPGPRLAEEP